MDAPEGTPQPFASADDLAALTARVAELERELSQLRPRPRTQVGWQESAPPAPVTYATVTPPETAPPPPPQVVFAAPPPRVPAKSLEERFGSQLFNLIGIAALFIAASLALKLAIDKGLVGPAARVLLGLLAGTGVILWSERFRRQGLQAFSWSLKAIGSGVLYLSLWAAFHLFHLVPAAVALVAMVLVTAWNAFMAWSQDAELLAAYALAGGFATPLLLATGGDHEMFLFTYLAAIDLALVLLLRAKPWDRLVLPGFGATVLYFMGWYSSFFRNFSQVTIDRLFWQTLAFTWIFAAIFAAVSVRGFLARTLRGIIVSVLVPLATATFLSLALYSVFIDSGLGSSLSWLMLALAAVYLALLRIQATAVAKAVHLSCAIVFLTVAIPLKAHGHTLTSAWLIEGLVLYWVSGRLTPHDPEIRASVRVLHTLAALGYVLGLLALTFDFTLGNRFGVRPESVLGGNLGAALLAAATLAGAAYLATRNAKPTPAFAAMAAAAWVGLLLTGDWLLSNRWMLRVEAPALTRAVAGLLVLGGTAYAAHTLSRARFVGRNFERLAQAVAVAANLVALLIVIRKIDLVFGAKSAIAESDLQRSLAISAWLMLYGAALLTAGFLRRSAFTRWQALVLILFTIVKVFLYDLSALSQGYRIVSIFALGALLMGVSLAYQRDWLGLRAAPKATPQAEKELR